MKSEVRYWVSFLLLLHSSLGIAQQYFYDDKYYDSDWLIGIGLNAGAMNALTDLGGGKGTGKMFLKDINLVATKPCTGVQINLIYKYIIGFRLGFTNGMVGAADSLVRNTKSASESRRDRHLHFRSPIREFSLQADWFFLQSINENTRFSPFLSAGIGYFIFNPQAKLTDRWIDLAPLHTEGQGFDEYSHRNPYSLQQINFPISVGIDWELSALFRLRSEICYRFLQTDYLDDVSSYYIDPDLFYKYLDPEHAYQASLIADRRRELNPNFGGRLVDVRGNPKHKDAYFSLTLGASIILNRKRR